MVAQDLKSALANLDESCPLVFEDIKNAPPAANPCFYIDRPDNPLSELKVYLLNSHGNEKILFSGHVGNGKSTELNKLASESEIKNGFFVVKYSISKVLNIIDIDYIDFLLCLTAQVFLAASDNGITFDAQILERIEKWIGSFKDESEFKDIDQGDSRIKKVVVFFRNVTAILLREILLRNKIREIVQRNIGYMVELMNSIISTVQTNLPGGKQLLVIIDDLEKIPHIQKAEELFIKAGIYMATPTCKVVYTAPIALYYSLKFQPLTGIFQHQFFLPNIKIRNKDDEDGSGVIDPMGCMQRFAEKRMSATLFDPEVLKTAIKYSGGVVREFVRILRNCCIKALSKGRNSIGRDIVFEVVQDLRNEFDRGLEKRHFDILNLVKSNSATDDTETKMELFHSRVLLEYKNGERWTAINPIVLSLLKDDPKS